MELLRNEPIDLVVLDVMLPDASGLQVCRQIRDEGLGVPILVISALDRRDDKLAALSEGADDYMTKPFDPSEVVARVHSLIRRTQPTLAPQLQTMLCVGQHLPRCAQPVCSCGRRRHAHRAYQDGSPVIARADAQRGHVVSHERLISEAWGNDYEGSSNQLEVYMHRLRKKMRGEWASKS